MVVVLLTVFLFFSQHHEKHHDMGHLSDLPRMLDDMRKRHFTIQNDESLMSAVRGMGCAARFGGCVVSFTFI